MLEYKASKAGRALVRIGRFEPTSQVCSACGVKDGPKPLSVREWTCKDCGSAHDRDVNAAINIKKAAGLAVSARGAQVGPGAILAQRATPAPAGQKQEPTEAVTRPQQESPSLQGSEDVNTPSALPS